MLSDNKSRSSKRAFVPNKEKGEEVSLQNQDASSSTETMTETKVKLEFPKCWSNRQFSHYNMY
jgi:hypothetical protein